METLFKNPHLAIPALTYLIAQSLKMFNKARKGDFNWRYMFATGDMPSVHTAVATSLLMSLGFVEGVGSAVFAVGAVWALFIIYDSLNVRRAVGEQGGVILKLIELSRAPKEERDMIKVREVLGHTPLEVLAGAGTGLSLGFILSYRYWPDSLVRALSNTGDTERYVYYALFASVLILGYLLKKYYVRKGERNLPTARRVMRAVRSAFNVPAVMGLIAVWLQDQSIRFFTTKTWILFLLGWIVVVGIGNYVRTLRRARALINEEVVHHKHVRRSERKARRFNKKHKRK